MIYSTEFLVDKERFIDSIIESDCIINEDRDPNSDDVISMFNLTDNGIARLSLSNSNKLRLDRTFGVIQDELVGLYSTVFVVNNNDTLRPNVTLISKHLIENVDAIGAAKEELKFKNSREKNIVNNEFGKAIQDLMVKTAGSNIYYDGKIDYSHAICYKNYPKLTVDKDKNIVCGICREVISNFTEFEEEE